uniref:Evasin P942 n=1 Tax=Ixodes ricinus TaxID=34613 RepID=EV942_IXORI|nr:RecName: Full=Evasin P942; Flags: Precursor [Ixodes ricinus]
MEVKTFAFLQIAVLIALGLHLAPAGSNQLSGPQSSANSNEAVFCDTNCTQGTDEAWSGCRGDCFCVYVGNSTEGRCMMLSGDFDYSTPGAED